MRFAFLALLLLAAPAAAQRVAPVVTVEQLGADGASPVAVTELLCRIEEPCAGTLPTTLGPAAVAVTFRPGFATVRLAVQGADGAIRPLRPEGGEAAIQVPIGRDETGRRVVTVVESAPAGGFATPVRASGAALLRITVAPAW
jgi:hypothetical protein